VRRGEGGVKVTHSRRVVDVTLLALHVRGSGAVEDVGARFVESGDVEGEVVLGEGCRGEEEESELHRGCGLGERGLRCAYQVRRGYKYGSSRDEEGCGS
jgi:hypothetical protein